MAKNMKHPSQGLLLLCVVLLACSTIPARVNGRSIDAKIRGDVVAETTTMAAAGASGAATVLRSYGGCSYNTKPHDNDSIFCCDKDHECWGSLQECMPNCPCKKGQTC
ncbi:hypothetical protein EJB05_09136 [Eragrostis curvula]|uniref:Embryo surrounding factor 1 brassicaceae domain-containing protein n=1 Tax=Eragrostis curvula TaxID=38414 RepID=A0A5J9W459_9POAL|nr:hypothetical protein EJB05_09136 [Eragrostis curvula]